MSDSNWKATNAEDTVMGESYNSVIEQIKRADTKEIWVLQYHDSTDSWTPLDKVKVDESGKIVATSKNSL